jgi:hypothetical protein
MNSTLMRKSQRSGDSIWSLPRGRQGRCASAPARACSRSRRAGLWLTTSGTADEAATDLWLEAVKASSLAMVSKS